VLVLVFYNIYHRVASGKHFHHDHHDHKHDNDDYIKELHRYDLELFRAFLRSLLMHAVIGTAIGGVCTLVGEPQNLLIAEQAGWTFAEFFYRMAPVTMPVLVVGLVMCYLLEKSGYFGYGAELPENVRVILADFSKQRDEAKTNRQRAALVVQGIAGLWLIVALGLHLAEVGIIGLSILKF